MVLVLAVMVSGCIRCLVKCVGPRHAVESLRLVSGVISARLDCRSFFDAVELWVVAKDRDAVAFVDAALLDVADDLAKVADSVLSFQQKPFKLGDARQVILRALGVRK